MITDKNQLCMVRVESEGTITPEIEVELKAIEAMSDSDVDTSDIPEITDWNIREATGVDKRKRTVEHHDLDALAGTWSDKDEMEFKNATQSLDAVDAEMWK